MSAFQREAPKSTRTSHTVFTPPRDDFGLGPPVEGHNEKAVADGPTPFVATHQAFCLLVKTILCLLIVFIVIVVSYFVISMFYHKPVVFVCSPQSLLYGHISAGMEGNAAVAICNEGYERYAPISSLSCVLVRENCVITKKATVMREAVEKCERDYAFTSEEFAKEALLNGSYTVAKVAEQTMYANPSACRQTLEAKLKTQYANATSPSTLYEKKGQFLPHALRGVDYPRICSIAFIVMVGMAILGLTHDYKRRRQTLPISPSPNVADESECVPLLEMELAQAPCGTEAFQDRVAPA